MARDAVWMHEAKWGVMMHFLPNPPGPLPAGRDVSAAEWNEQVESFDVEHLAETLERLGAGYMFLTVGQITGHFCSPNAAYDEITAISPSKCSRRDLIAEAGAALRRRGISLIAYIHSSPPVEPPAAAAFEMGPAARAADPRLTAMQGKWQRVLREWSVRWGPLVRGWWVDGCYGPEMYKSLEPPNWASFAGALRAGNAEAVLAFNPGVGWPLRSITDQDDYLAGEVDGAFFAGYWAKSDWRPLPAVYQDVRLHVLSFLGDFWNTGDAPRLPDEMAAGYTKFIHSRGGSVTWDVPITRAGRFRDGFGPQLEAIGRIMRA